MIRGLIGLLTLSAGVAVGRNWPKIKDFFVCSYKEVSDKAKKLKPRREPTLEEKFLKLVNETPGITLVEASKVLGVVRIRLGNIVKTLIEEGRIRKEEKLYFPVN